MTAERADIQDKPVRLPISRRGNPQEREELPTDQAIDTLHEARRGEGAPCTDNSQPIGSASGISFYNVTLELQCKLNLETQTRR